MNARRAALRLIALRSMMTSLLAIASAHGQSEVQPAPAPAAQPESQPGASSQPAPPAKPENGQWLSRTVDGIMGTRIFVEIWAEDAPAGEAAIDAVMDEMRHIDDTMSTYKPTSEVSRVNASAAKRPVHISRELFGLLGTALEYSRITEGAFDITYASVGYLYDFRERRRPTEQQIAAALPAVNYRHVLLDRKTSSVRFSQPGVRIDLGGIAKGFAVDQGIAILKARGYSHALVNAGGDSRVIGDRRGRPWMVGIRHPDHPDQVITRIPLVDAAFSTSGDYERYFDEDGVRYHHIIDPHTGHSASKVRSATVIAPTATRTDGLSKTAFVLGADEAMRIYNQLDDVDAVLVAPDGRILYSKGLTPGDAAPAAAPPAAAPPAAAPPAAAPPARGAPAYTPPAGTPPAVH